MNELIDRKQVVDYLTDRAKQLEGQGSERNAAALALKEAVMFLYSLPSVNMTAPTKSNKGE